MNKNMGSKIPAILAGAALLSGCSSHKAASLPNIIILYGDDIGYGDLSCNGENTICTPNVERVANEGVRFTNAHTASATSTPARYGLLTGQYPWRKEGTGIAAGNAGMIISPEQYTIADMCREAGYVTGAVGKWHLGLGVTAQQDWNGVVSPALCDIGFDYSYIMAATADRVPCVFIENGKVVGLDPSDPISVSYDENFPGEPTGRDNPELLTKLKPSHGHDMSIVNGISRIGYMKGGKSALWVDEDIAGNITDKAIEFICNNSKKPFFLYLGTNDIHVPRVPNEKFRGKSGMGPRGDSILSFDYTVGEVLQTLDSLGIADNTLLIISSDNGPVVDDGYQDMAVELLGNHRPWGEYRGSKYSAFEAGTRTPLVVRWPGHIAAGKVSEQLFSHIDIFASIAKLLGVSLSEGVAPDSRDCLSTLMGDDTDVPYVIEQNLNGTLSIFDGEWKYIEASDGPASWPVKNVELGNLAEPQLYNLLDDIHERQNVAGVHPEKLLEMSALLNAEKNKQ